MNEASRWSLARLPWVLLGNSAATAVCMPTSHRAAAMAAADFPIMTASLLRLFFRNSVARSGRQDNRRAGPPEVNSGGRIDGSVDAGQMAKDVIARAAGRGKRQQQQTVAAAALFTGQVFFLLDRLARAGDVTRAGQDPLGHHARILDVVGLPAQPGDLRHGYVAAAVAHHECVGPTRRYPVGIQRCE